LNVKDTLLSVVLAYILITLAMKNYWNAFVVLASLLIFSACSITQPGSQQTLVADDLYDSFQKPASAYIPKKSSHYLDPEEDATLIQEEDGVLIQEDESNFLNSRSVYANSYAEGYSSGFQSGIFASNPWNNWYSNPYISFGLGGFYGSRIIAPINAWGMYDPFYNPYSLYSPYSYYDPFFGYSGLRYPYGYAGLGMRGIGYFGNYGGYNNYGNNFYYAPSVGNVNREPNMPVNRAPRDERSSNRYGGGNINNSPRGGNNAYNTQSTNQPRVNSDQYNNAPVQAAPRRNTNFEYRSAQPQTNYGQQSQQNYSAPSSNYNSGGSSSGGNSGGGSSRGPR